MKNNKKKILAIVLVVLVLILGGASVYVATQISTRQAVAPNAPTSKPAAAECADYTTSSTCTAESTCSWFSSCSKCAITGTAEGTVCPEWSSSCVATGSATASVQATVSAIIKEAFSNADSNTAGSYSQDSNLKKTGGTAVLAPGETYVYNLWATNPTTATYSGKLTFTDVLTGNNLDLLSVVDLGTGCSYTESTRTMVCTLDYVKPGTWGRAFRVKLSSSAANGTTITNKVTAVAGDQTLTASNVLTVVATSATTLTGSKTAYKNETANTAGKYTLATEMSTVSKSQTYVYSISLTNGGDATATGVTVKDSLADVTNLTFVDTVSGCTWSSTDKALTCNTTLKPSESKTFSFRVKAASGIANGDVISNTATVTSDNTDSLSLTKDLTVSTVVGCNNTCTTDTECTNGLTCDSTTSKCRLAACLTQDDCVCPTATTTKTVTTVVVTKTVTPTKVAETTVTPTTLPETGILDIPGVAAFGGGLILAVVGILLAL